MKNLISQREIEELLSFMTEEQKEVISEDNETNDSLEMIADLLDEVEDCLSFDKYLNAGYFYDKLLKLQAQIIKERRS